MTVRTTCCLVETFARFQAGFKIFMEFHSFHDFHRFPQILMVFVDLGDLEAWVLHFPAMGHAAPEETVA